MSVYTRNFKAIKIINKRINTLIKIVAFCNKMIGKGLNTSKAFKLKNKYFKKLCQLQDILKLELKLNKILLKRTKYNSLYLDYFNNFISVRKFAEYYNITLLIGNTIINKGRKINHSLTN